MNLLVLLLLVRHLLLLAWHLFLLSLGPHLPLEDAASHGAEPPQFDRVCPKTLKDLSCGA